MATSPTSKVQVHLTSSANESEPARPDPTTPFRIAILSDLGGRSNRGSQKTSQDIARHRPMLVDRDNFDHVLNRHQCELHLNGFGNDARPIVLQFSSLEDFHPDSIFERVELFQELRRTRNRLQNPATFADAADQVRSWANVRAAAPRPRQPEPATKTPPRQLPPVNAQGLLDQVLDVSQPGGVDDAGPSVGATSDWNAYIRSIVEPYTVPGTDPQQPALIACVDEIAASLMRAILHHRDFQAVEAVWRAVHLLVHRLETDSQLTVNLIDISKQELTNDLAEANDLRSTGVYKMLMDQSIGTPGGQRWALLIGDYTFDYTSEDAALFGRLGMVAQAAGAPLIASAHAHFVGCESLVDTPDPDDWLRSVEPEVADAWSNLRQLPYAAYLGLAMPRFLLRLPYGKATDPTDQFAFEELGAVARHDDYLWGNPAFACGCLIGQSFSAQGWGMRLDEVKELGGLPVHVVTKDGEREVTPCAEVLLSERALERIAGNGLIPLISYRGRDFIRLPGFRSISM